MDDFTKNLTTLRDACLVFTAAGASVGPAELERMRHSVALADVDGALRYAGLYPVAARGWELERMRRLLRMVENVRTELYELYPQEAVLAALYPPNPKEATP